MNNVTSNTICNVMGNAISSLTSAMQHGWQRLTPERQASQPPAAQSLQLQLTVKRGAFTLELNNSLPLHGVTALFGRSGCGKTTLLRAIAGLDRHAKAQIRCNDVVWA